MAKRGKVVAVSTATVGLVVLVAAVIAGKDRIAEQYSLLRLESADEATRLSAAEALADMKSVRAVPTLIRLLRDENRELAQLELPNFSVSGFTPIAHALYRIGEPAVAGLEEAELQMAKAEESPLLLRLIVDAIRSEDLTLSKREYSPGSLWMPLRRPRQKL